MSLTEQQKAYHLRKMRTVAVRLNWIQDGASRESFEQVGKRLAQYSTHTEEQAMEFQKGLMKLADLIHLKEGDKFSVDEYLAQFSNTLLSKSSEESKAMIHHSHAPIIEIIDTDKDGLISVEEFKVYLRVATSGVSEEEAEHAFNTIDINKKGKISQEEFFAAALDFFFGVEETKLSKVFWGKLVN